MTAEQHPPTVAHGRFSHHTAAHRGEVRLPAIVAMLAAGILHAVLPHQLLAEPRWVIPVFVVALLIALSVVNPTRLTTETRWSRIVSLVLVTVIIATNTYSLVFLLRDLTALHGPTGRDLLVAALNIWVTNMIAFGLVFWELDRGGAVARLPTASAVRRRTDFLFPQDDADTARRAMGAADTPWIPLFVDYLYLSLTNSVAFSPTDTLPLTPRAKVLMGIESLAAMVTSLLVIARAVNILA